MKNPRRLSFFLLLLPSAPQMIWAQVASDPLPTLLRQLQTRETTEEARAALLRKAEADTEVKTYLASTLPPIIEAGAKRPTSGWLNAVRLAGELKITEAAPALGSCIAIDNMGGEITSGSLRYLETIPAAKALAQIGDPAIPTLVGVLNHGTARERRNAYLVLNLIGSKDSLSILNTRLEQESDQPLKQYVRGEVAILHPPDKQQPEN